MAYQGKFVTVQDVSGQVANGTGATRSCHPLLLVCGAKGLARTFESAFSTLSGEASLIMSASYQTVSCGRVLLIICSLHCVSWQTTIAHSLIN